MIINEVLLRRKNLLSLNPISDEDFSTSMTKRYLVTICKNIESLGYCFDKDVMEFLMKCSDIDLKNIYLELVPMLKALVGADVEYEPMYPNFPEQVVEASDAELWINAIIHYLSFGELLPNYSVNERIPLIDAPQMKKLGIGSKEDIMGILANLMGSKTSLSTQDENDILSIVSEFNDYANYLPSEIPLKENVALLGKILVKEYPKTATDALSPYFNTATDVLRFAVALSDGDTSLATNTKFKKFNRAERRLIMNLLNCVGDRGQAIEDMFRYKEQWLRIGEIVHPREFSDNGYKMVKYSFHMIRENSKPLMFAGKVAELIRTKQINSAVDMLVNRTGEFARSLDKLLREADDKNYVINKFRSVANQVSTPVLLQVRQHFMNRDTENNRVFFPKGSVAKAMIIPNNLSIIEDKYCKIIVKICENALVNNYQDKEFIGSVYIDEDLKNYIVPFSQRSASASSKIVVRGSKIPLKEDATAVRAFIWWTNSNSRVDIDLSATFFTDNWDSVSYVSYTNLRYGSLQTYHSGDITNGGSPSGKGVAEFLDVNIEAASSRARYLVYQVYSYTGQEFSNLPNCRFGFMEREDVNSGEIFEPTTVEMKIDLQSNSTTAIPVIFDLKERKMIWCDMNIGLSKLQCGGNNVESNIWSVKDICRAIVDMNKPNLYDLAKLHAAARGLEVASREEADIIFSNDTTPIMETIEEVVSESGNQRLIRTFTREKDVQFITAFDTDYIVGQLL